VKSILASIALLAVSSLAIAAGYSDTILKPWIGATKQDLVAKWGYPQASTDLFHIDEQTEVYTYRSFRQGPVGQAQCVVSFVLQKDVVINWKYEGENCPRYERDGAAAVAAK